MSSIFVFVLTIFSDLKHCFEKKWELEEREGNIFVASIDCDGGGGGSIQLTSSSGHESFGATCI